jgi:pimeloyl-ACP methyl ester carboxylesterase
MDVEQHNGLAYQYKEGNGRPIVFIHGWVASKQSWQHVTDETELDNPMLFYDQRCHGDSFCDEFELADLVDDLRSLLNHLGIDRPILAGQSLGGMVALQAVLDGVTDSVFLAGGFASRPRPVGKSPKFFLSNLGEMDRDRWAEKIMHNYAPESDAPELIRLSKKQIVNAAMTALRCGLQAMINNDLREILRTKDIDACVVGGKNDGAIPSEQSRELADLLNCPLHLLEASHLMLEQEPGEVARLLEAFVNNHR